MLGARSWVRILPVKQILLPFLLLCASLLSAQTRKPPKPVSSSASKLISIRVTGSTRYTLNSKVEVMSLAQCVTELA